MTTMPQVSVIIPLYNKGPYVRRTLDSVFAQTFEDYEVIVVDDGSTDDGPRIVMADCDPRLRIIRQINAGPGAARNRGIEEARGKYIAFLDADDEWLSEYLEQSFRILELNPTCDVCISGWYQDYHGYGPLGGKLYQGKSVLEIGTEKTLAAGPANVFSVKNSDNLLLMWWTTTVFVRKKVFTYKYRFYDSSKYTYGEDYYLWIQLAFNHDFYRNLKSLAWYHNDNSELTDGHRYVNAPLEAFMLWPELIISNCLQERKKLLCNWLASYALRYAHLRFGVGQLDNVIFLLKKYPNMASVNFVKFLLLLMKICLFKLMIYRPCRK